MVDELQSMVTLYTGHKYATGITNSLLEYQINPDPIILSQQTVAALKDELAQEEDQMKFKYQYNIVLEIMRKYWEDKLQAFESSGKGNANLIKTPLDEYYEAANKRKLSIEEREGLLLAWIGILKIALQ